MVKLHLQRLYGDVKPRNFTIEDSKWAPENNPPSTTENTTALLKQKSSEQPAIRLDATLKAMGK